jgi:chromosome transmission fidelity protein 1
VKTTHSKDTKVISLGSRKTLCINDSVLALKSQTRMNEACLDMQKSRLEML